MRTVLKVLMLVMIFAMPAMAFAQVPGCTDPLACNYDELATEDNGTCDYTCYGCTNQTAQNYDPDATIDDGSCQWQECVPYELIIEEACVWDPQSEEFITRVEITPLISGVCFLQEICYQEVGGGISACIDLPAIGQYITTGESFIVPLFSSGIFEFTASTSQGTSDPVQVTANCYDNENACGNPYAVNYDPEAEDTYELACVYDQYICDCAGTQHNLGVLIWLGDGFYEEGTDSFWYGQPVDFACNVWGWDCGDGGIIHDPYDTCIGELPPNGGCSAPSCTPMTMLIENEPCTYSDSLGIQPAVSVQFNMFGDCGVTTLRYSVNQQPFVTIDLTDVGLTNGDVYILENIQEGEFQFNFTSTSGATSPYFYHTTQTCAGENTICDCSGTMWWIETLDFLGDGNLNNGTAQEGFPQVNFNCLTWAYDCGDAGIDDDPVGVCEGNLPPANGCTTLFFGCTDEDACNYNENVNYDDGSCDYESCLGCTDEAACNYYYQATVDDGSCDYESCLGCTDENACNYDSEATQENGSCTYDCVGCLNPDACNYDPEASINDDSCHFDCYGCTDVSACNYNPDATIDNGLCNNDCQGCTSPLACNYDPYATMDDGSCESISCYGCTDPIACNFDSFATLDNGLCDYDCLGCTDVAACNYDATATQDDGNCDYSCFGCTDTEACNFDPVAEFNDGSCDYSCIGCTDPDACNYNALATFDDGSCTTECIGCMDPGACNYDMFALISDGSCDYFTCQGCTLPTACNYDEEATIDNGSCDFDCYGCIDPGACNYDVSYTIDDGSCDYESCVGCMDEGACNYDANAIIDGENCEFVTCQGCMDETALNYDEDALIDDQSCIYECAFPEVVWESLDCDETGGSLYVKINVTEVGNAAPYTMINNVSDQVVVISSPNEWILGPFEASDIVVCTLISQAFPSCVTTGPAMSCAVNVSERILPEVSIFPNPASTSIQVNADQEIKEVSLYDKSGRNVHNEQNLSVRSMTLDISTLAPGFYTVRALVGNDVMNQRLVIVR